jgi:glycosyltransferase involved in cell wall biosynthesis
MATRRHFAPRLGDSPLVSVCIITYNHQPFVAQALDSILSQETDFPFELLVHDDCSTDGTTEILRDYASRYPDLIRPVYQQENQYSKGRKAFPRHCQSKLA